MSWISDAVDWVGDLFGGEGTTDSTSWWDRNKDWVGKVVDVGANAAGKYQENKAKSDARSKLVDQLQAIEDEQYQLMLQESAYNNAQGSGGGGGGGGAYGGPSNESLTAAINVLKKKNKNLNKMTKPYVQTGKRLLPVYENMATQSASGIQNMLETLMSAGNMKKMEEGDALPYEMNLPAPAHLLKKKGV
jgi:hypothetical protein